MVTTQAAGVTAAAGTGLTQPLFLKLFTLQKSNRLNPIALGVPPSLLRALRRLRACCTPWGSGPCLSSRLGATALTAPTDQWFGRPLPYQQPNPPRTHPKAPELWAKEPSSIHCLWGIVLSFPRLFPALGQIIHVLLSLTPRI